MRAAEQTFIPGTEPPPDPTRTAEDDDRVYAWLDAKAAQKKASEDTKTKHAIMIAALGERQLERYPYVDQFTGKKRFVVVKREPKAATTNAPSNKPRKERKPREKKPDPAEQVEHRKVSRASVEDEIDPFAKTRAKMTTDVEESPTNGHAKPKKPRKAKR